MSSAAEVDGAAGGWAEGAGADAAVIEADDAGGGGDGAAVVDGDAEVGEAGAGGFGEGAGVVEGGGQAAVVVPAGVDGDVECAGEIAHLSAGERVAAYAGPGWRASVVDGAGADAF